MRTQIRIIVLVLVLLAGTATAATARPAPRPPKLLTLLNGWVGGPYGTSAPAAVVLDGVVHLKGALWAGSSAELFTLPAGYRPAENAFVPVDLCNPTSGMLWIQPNGRVIVQTALLSDAQCFVSLDGAVFLSSAAVFTPVATNSGWYPGELGTGNPGVLLSGDIVYWKGGVSTDGTNWAPVLSPPAYTLVGQNTYPTAASCNSRHALIMVQRNTVLFVSGDPASVQCLTSLDGVNYGRATATFTRLTPVNGWAGHGNAPFVGAKVLDRVVHLKGTISTAGTDPHPFVLPRAFRPRQTVYVHTDTCYRDGRLVIDPSGLVTAVGRQGFADAACQTSLDGVSYVI